MRDHYESIEILSGPESGDALTPEAWVLRLTSPPSHAGNTTAATHVLSDHDLDLLIAAAVEAKVGRELHAGLIAIYGPGEQADARYAEWRAGRKSTTTTTTEV